MRPLLPAAVVLGFAAAAFAQAEPVAYGHFVREISGLDDPVAVAVSSLGVIAVADRTAGAIRRFALDGGELPVWRGGEGAERLVAPSGIAWGADGLIYVADAGLAQIVVLDQRGTPVRRWGEWGSGPGQLRDPAGIDVTGDALLVADRGNDRIQIFGLDGTPRSAFGTRGSAPGELMSPSDVAAGPDGSIAVADTGNHRVQRFGPEGELLVGWGEWGVFPGLFSEPTALHAHGRRLYVTDRLGHRVQVFDAGGSFLEQWGMHAVRPREGGGRIHYPAGLAIAPDGVFAVVAEPFERRLQLFTPGIETIPPLAREATRGMQSHFGSLVDVSGRLLAVWEPETRQVIAFDLQPDEPVLITQLGGYGRGFGALAHPAGMIVEMGEERSSIFITDPGNGRLNRFDLSFTADSETRFDPFVGRFAKSWSYAALGASGGTAAAPGPIARAPGGAAWAIDGDGAHLLRFDEQMRVQQRVGGFGAGPGELRGATDLAVSADGERIFVVDAGNHRIQAFDAEGHALGTWGARGDGPGDFVRPFGIAAGRDGYVYVTDEGADRVQKFDETGTLVAQWGTTGIDDGRFWKPRGIVQDERLRLVVMDYGNHRLQIFDAEGQWVATFGAGRGSTRRQR